jgi:hypothetical protein
MREQVLDALFARLKTLESDQLKVFRNLDKPQKVPEEGIVILRDGSSAEPEVLLSPLTYIYEHDALLEVVVQNPDQAARDAALDELLTIIGGAISADRTLGGLAEWIEARAPEFQDEPIEGAATIHSAAVPVMIRFSTSDPLN